MIYPHDDAKKINNNNNKIYRTTSIKHLYLFHKS